ncbi:MAG: spore germination protein [Syntrophomonadaceae bacterium]|jgi:hypothetical protein
MRYINERNIKEPPDPHEIVDQPLTVNLSENRDRLKILLKSCSDAVFKQFVYGPAKTNILLVYFDGLVNRTEIEENILKPLLLEVNMLNDGPEDTHNILNYLQDNILSVAELKSLTSLQEVCHHMSSGDTVLLIDGYDQGLVIGTRSWQTRSIQAPDNEVVIRGPKEGFTETLRFNTALLRRRLKTTNFKMESFILGRATKTDVVLGYIEDIAPAGLVEKIRERLKKIDIDGVLDSGYLEEFLEEKSFTVFSQLEYTEKPDRICAHLLEGRVCILVDGSPTALVLPTTFPRFWIAAEDYYERFVPGSLFRLLRFGAFWVSLLLPSLFVALITYHHEMIPTTLFLTIAAARQGVPFPAIIEALILEFSFELLREAGIRLPRAVGPAISIVGALIIGDAAVKAGLVSTPMVIVVALTGIASFIIPAYNAGITLRIVRFGFLAAAGFLGLFGIMIAFIIMMTHIVSLSSFGIPYFSPLIPVNRAELSDTLVRRPWFTNIRRPKMKGMKNEIRQKEPANKKDN